MEAPVTQNAVNTLPKAYQVIEESGKRQRRHLPGPVALLARGTRRPNC